APRSPAGASLWLSYPRPTLNPDSSPMIRPFTPRPARTAHPGGRYSTHARDEAVFGRIPRIGRPMALHARPRPKTAGEDRCPRPEKHRPPGPDALGDLRGRERVRRPPQRHARP